MHITPIEIIRLPVTDWQAYRRLRLEALQESPQAFGSNFEEQASKPDSYWKMRLEEAAKGEQSWLVFARLAQQLVGMCGAYRGGIEDAEKQDQAVIIALYVTPSWRAQGIAKMLMQSILDILKESAIKVAVLGINVEQEAALRLYEGVGFRKISKTKALMGDGMVHEMLNMEKLL